MTARLHLPEWLIKERFKIEQAITCGKQYYTITVPKPDGMLGEHVGTGPTIRSCCKELNDLRKASKNSNVRGSSRRALKAWKK